MILVKFQDTKLIYRHLLCLYIINKLSERGRKRTPFRIVSKKISIPKNKLNQGDRKTNKQTNKTLMKEIEDDTNEWKIHHSHLL